MGTRFRGISEFSERRTRLQQEENPCRRFPRGPQWSRPDFQIAEYPRQLFPLIRLPFLVEPASDLSVHVCTGSSSVHDEGRQGIYQHTSYGALSHLYMSLRFLPRSLYICTVHALARSLARAPAHNCISNTARIAWWSIAKGIEGAMKWNRIRSKAR